MDRRLFFATGAATLASMSAPAAMNNLGGYRRRAFVAQPHLVQQQCPLWCWAASISMIFKTYGYDVPQQKIVQETFGSVVCVASGNPVTIARDLSRDWTDSGGNSFTSQVTAAYDAWNGINTLDNRFIVSQLANDKPLLYCNTHHAMVLVAVDFFDTPGEPNVVAAGVLDPFPGNAGFHALSPPELRAAQMGGQMTFLAAVDVS